ncbi:MAG TPA: hypothetical protein H9807_07650, partial [Candidatus Bacteroides merdavium]|nr:hypothetical protein [Candidatus Bacteroides merdavium]
QPSCLYLFLLLLLSADLAMNVSTFSSRNLANKHSQDHKGPRIPHKNQYFLWKHIIKNAPGRININFNHTPTSLLKVSSTDTSMPDSSTSSQ